ILLAVITMLVLGLIILLAPAAASAQAGAAAPKGKGFPTAQDAANALVDATEKYDEAALTEVLGPDSFDIIHSGEPVRDRELSLGFAAQAWTKMNVELDKTKTRATM